MEKLLELFTPLFGAIVSFISLPDLYKISKIALSLVTPSSPWQFLVLFLASSLLIIWRLNALESRGVEGTVTGTIVMPYCSGFSNLSFAYVMGTTGGAAEMVLENCIVNNVTNLTVLLGLPALLWGLNIFPQKKKKPNEKLTHLSLILTLVAMLFFTTTTWILARDGALSRGDGLVLIGLFLFWQLFQIIEVMKTNIRKRRSISRWIIFDLVMVAGAALGTYFSVDGFVTWVSEGGGGVISYNHLGIISGLLMVIPNGILAIYYSAVGRSDIAYSSQIGDAHICIPMCIGIFAAFSPIKLPTTFEIGIWIIIGATLAHLLFLGIFGRLPRIVGTILIASYAFFIINGVLI